MAAYPRSVQVLIQRLSRLPGIGQKGAERLALHLVRASAKEAAELSQAIAEVKKKARSCRICFNLADTDPCPICADPQRDQSSVCVVETPADLAAMEGAGSYRGVYHVLSGTLSPLDGVGPGGLRLSELIARVKAGRIKEVIIATNPTVEGEATAELVAQKLSGLRASVSRLGYGMPVGGDLKYMDGLTLLRSLQSRRKLEPSRKD